jgi:hypothetical protein
MKKSLLPFAVPALCAATVFIGCTCPKITERTDPTRSSSVQTGEGYDTFGRKWDGAPKPEMLTRSDYVLLHYTGTITDIDYANREMTLKGSDGQFETVYVAPDVKRFTEAKVGDKVSLDYYLGVTAEVRKPTAEEERNPLVVLESTGKAAADAPPAARDMRQVRAVCTIESLDRKAQTITVKGPRGKYFTARVADPTRFDKVRIGETVLMTFTEATAVSLNPAN